MIVLETYQPAPQLRPYIEKYWKLQGFLHQEEVINIIPDGCTALCFNLGDDFRSLNFGITIKNSGIYLVGTTLRADEQVFQGEVNLLCIQFKPGAFSHFYSYGTMTSYSDKVIEFEPQLFPDIRKILKNSVCYLDDFFLDRLRTPKNNSILEITTRVTLLGGQIKISDLTKQFYITERQLERQFGIHMGISPKEFIRLTRFRNALRLIQLGSNGQTLAHIAWDCGYYDHAHLTNDFKRYAGVSPTKFILSDFSKTRDF